MKHIDLRAMLSQQQSECDSPRLPCHSPKSNITTNVLAKCHLLNQFQYFNLYQILEKSHTNRTHMQNKTINEFINKSIGLNELSQLNGRDFCKGIMRTAVLEEYEENDIIEYKGNDADSIYIVLEGKVGSIKNEDETDMIEHISRRQVYEILMNKARKQSKKLSKLVRKFSSWRDYSQDGRQKYDRNEETSLLQTFQKGQSFGDKVRCFGEIYPHTYITLQKSILLSFDVKNVAYWLNHSFEQKLLRLEKQMKNIPCFAILEDEMLEQIITYLSIHKIKKNEYIYDQNSEVYHLFFLEQGQIKIQKQYHLFVANPNQLYVDRRKLMTERQRDNKQFLPYANFEKLYNYRPIKKIAQLGILNPFCMFGEEDIIEGKSRETSVKCQSLIAVYYSIELRKLYQILGDSLSLFFEEIKLLSKDKIKYRQASYATTINIQNKNNLKYFYFEGQTQLPTPRKYILKRINDKIIPDHSNASFIHTKRSIHTDSQGNETEEVNPEFKRPIKLSNQKNYQNKIPPFYNTFNFHKMIKAKLSKKQLSKLSLNEAEQQQLKNQNNSFKSGMKQQIKRENQIINNSHTWYLVKQKVQMEKKISKKMGSQKQSIEFGMPLIDNKYFQHMESQMKRIQREKKAGKFNVSIPRNIRATSLNTLKTNL